MRLFDWLRPQETVSLEGPKVALAFPTISDHAEWAAVRDVSREFLQPWEPSWAVDDLTRPGFRRRLDAYERERADGVGLALMIRARTDNRLVGQIRLSNIRRGVSQTASVGYWTGAPFVRRGYALAALQTLTAFAFGPFGLSRLEAQCLPANQASAALLLRAGFSEEGYAPAYLKINGVWCDHRLFGLISRDRAAERTTSGAGAPAT